MKGLFGNLGAGGFISIFLDEALTKYSVIQKHSFADAN